ncbi:MAG: carboxymuconolactone decarboxylase family protein [Candidatus Binatia bacterium]|nr:carboxymuconolactone decarboxylase family protein [Candidatus Binatia bacterium]
MPRIDYPNLDELHPKVRAALDGLPKPLNIFKISTLAERNFEPMMRLGGTILSRQQLAGNLRELAILRVAQLSSAEYEWVQHVPIAEMVGCTKEQIAALEIGDATASCFEDKERAVLAFTDEVLKDVRPTDDALTALKAHCPDREVMELTIAIGFYMLMARIMEVSGIETEAPVGDQIVRAASDGTN